jgi:hypothetical protein
MEPLRVNDWLGNESFMPIHWTIDTRAQLLTASAEGDVSMSDAMRFLEAVAGANALPYRKLFDGRQAKPMMSSDELLAVCVKIRSYHQHGTMGPLAMIGTAEQTVVFARLLGVLAAAERQIKVFEDPDQARAWIETLASA